jgi:hypothetical protein
MDVRGWRKTVKDRLAWKLILHGQQSLWRERRTFVNMALNI